MKTLVIITALITAVLGGTTAGQTAVNKTTPLKEGSIAPDFTLSDTTGKKITLSKINRPTILVFYRGYW